jgi:diguanylate cyclase (GGDEF)-like protein/PAS domain S-box-containing protein
MSGEETGAVVADPAGLSMMDLITRSPLANVLYDAEGHFLTCSAAWRKIVPEVEANRLAMERHRQGRPDLLRRCLNGETILTEPLEVQDEDGNPRWVRQELGPARNPAGELVYIVAHGRDVTAEERYRREVERADGRLMAALAVDRIIVKEIDLRTGEVYISDSCPDLRPLIEVQDYDLEHIFPEDRDHVARDLERKIKSAIAPCEIYGRHRYRLNDANRTWVSTVIKVTVNSAGQPETILLVTQDISEQMRQREEIERLAFTDALTGLPNRAQFQLKFEEAIADAETNGSSIGLVMVDVDHFKDINDTLGHDAGDALLKSLSEQMRRAFRGTDTVARLGGDEFAILLRDLESERDLVRPLDALRQVLATPVDYKGQGLRISTSIGAALHSDPDADPTHLLKNADIALYQAKENGRDRVVVFEPQMRSEVEQRLELLRDVRAAIPRGEFALYYQPVVSLGEPAVAGFEALMRWNHPDHGVLPPSHFMPALEDQDLSLQLGEVTIETALMQMRAWMDQGLPFGNVSINLAASQFRTGRLAEDLDRRLRHWGVPPERLTVEVTENVYLGWGAEIVAQTVKALHEQGVSIALDDFGTGYASLANLRQFPIDRLKIDKSFVQNDEDDAIVRAVINLGASMGMEVVAEGVERPEQLDVLSHYGCKHVQGFHFSRPLPPEEVPGYLRAFREAISSRSAA